MYVDKCMVEFVIFLDSRIHCPSYFVIFYVVECIVVEFVIFSVVECINRLVRRPNQLSCRVMVRE